jgi:hypothetical protein
MLQRYLLAESIMASPEPLYPCFLELIPHLEIITVTRKSGQGCSDLDMDSKRKSFESVNNEDVK